MVEDNMSKLKVRVVLFNLESFCMKACVLWGVKALKQLQIQVCLEGFAKGLAKGKLGGACWQ